MKKLLALVLLAFMANSPASENKGAAPLLHRDPFARRVAVEPLSEASAVAAVAPWTGQLRMTLRAGRQSMVNVDGKTVPLGGKIDGYTLVAVEERSARFVRNGMTITVGLDDDPRAKNEVPAAP